MIPRYHVNRHRELALLEDLLHPNTRRRMLFLRAQAGYGKTLLLERYQEHIEEHRHPLAVIDMKVPGLGIIDILTNLCIQWDSEQFLDYQKALQKASNPTATIDVQRVFQIGSPQLQVHLGQDPAQRQAQAHQLTESWFDDLRTWLDRNQRLPAVILIDTYNTEDSETQRATVDPEVQRWFESSFLTYIQRISAVRLILAGQQIPAANLTWERNCLRHELGPIGDPDDWMPLVSELGGSLSREVVSSHCFTAKGHPFVIATSLNLLCTQWSKL